MIHVENEVWYWSAAALREGSVDISVIMLIAAV